MLAETAHLARSTTRYKAESSTKNATCKQQNFVFRKKNYLEARSGPSFYTAWCGKCAEDNVLICLWKAAENLWFYVILRDAERQRRISFSTRSCAIAAQFTGDS